MSHSATVVDPRQFGVMDPTGNTDCTAVIQAAIDSIKPTSDGYLIGTSQGGVVRIPAGVYKVTSSLMIYSYVTVEGAQIDTVINAQLAASNRGVFEPTPVTANGIVQQFRLRNLQISAQTNGCGITFSGTSSINLADWVIDSVMFSTKNFAINFAGNYSQAGTVRDCIGTGLGAGFIWLEGNILRIVNSQAKAGVMTTFNGSTFPGIFTLRGADILVVQGHCETGTTNGAAVSFYLGGTGATTINSGIRLIDCWIENAPDVNGHTLVVDNVTDCRITSRGVTTGPSALYLINSSDVSLDYSTAASEVAFAESPPKSDLVVGFEVNNSSRVDWFNTNIALRRKTTLSSATYYSTPITPAPRSGNLLNKGPWTVTQHGDALAQIALQYVTGLGPVQVVSWTLGTGYFDVALPTINIDASRNMPPYRGWFGFAIDFGTSTGVNAQLFSDSFPNSAIVNPGRNIIPMITSQISDGSNGNTYIRFFGGTSGTVYISNAHFALGEDYGYPGAPASRVDFINERSIDFGTGAPTNGYWEQGSIRFNQAYASSPSVHHWRCTAGGTPGTWLAITL